MANQNTHVKTLSAEEEADILGIAGGPNIITPIEEKKSVLSDEEKEAERILNESQNKSAEELAAEEKKKLEDEEALVKAEADRKAKLLDAENKGASVLDQHVNDDDDQDDEDLEKNKGTGRPKLDKSLIAETVSDLIKEGVLFDFDYEAGKEKKLEDYTKQDYIDLIKGNFENKEETLKEEVNTQFFESLSPELKYLAKYEYDGGKNLVPVLKALLRLEENKTLDIANEKDQETIVYNFLNTTDFGTEEEIEKYISKLKDAGDGALEAEAKRVKPKLDAKHSEQIQKDIARQEQAKKEQQEMTEKYFKNVAAVLQKGELNGLKLDKKTQEKLFVGMSSTQFPSMNGSNTNLLGHLLEEYQIGKEPNLPLVLEALYLLSNPEEYRAKIKESGAKAQGDKTFRTLKTAEKEKGNNGVVDLKDDDKTPKRTNTIKRKNVLSRLP